MNRNKRLILTMLLIGLALLSVPRLAHGLSPDELHSLANDAHLSFRQANELIQSDPGQARRLYDQAILRYQSLVENGIENTHLYYNIANAYLLKGDLGRAILNYRRAQRLNGNDDNLVKNLAFARGKRLDQIPVKAQKRVLQTLFFWHYDFNMHTRLWLAAIFWIFASAVGALAFWRRKKVPLFWVSLACLLVAACFAGSIAYDEYQSQHNQQGVIVATEVVARQGDGENYPQSFKDPLHSGAEFSVLEDRANWLHIELDNGTQAWIPRQAAEII